MKKEIEVVGLYNIEKNRYNYMQIKIYGRSEHDYQSIRRIEK